MVQTFSALPKAIDNTLLVTEMCSGLKLESWAGPCCRTSAVPEGYDLDGYFRHVSLLGFAAAGSRSFKCARQAVIDEERVSCSGWSASST